MKKGEAKTDDRSMTANFEIGHGSIQGNQFVGNFADGARRAFGGIAAGLRRM